LVCLPIQPMPALRASAFSSTGPSRRTPVTHRADLRDDVVGQALQALRSTL
jgi:hypothetical protein